MSNLVGHLIAGRYRVDEFLGRGGMADVYKVWDQQRAAFLAMKVLHDNLAEDKIFIRRFRREAQNLAKLKHPNIVRFYELGEDGELIFMLMEYVSGVTLSKARRRVGGPFTEAQALGVMQPLCSALHYAHEIGLAHCDIKPGNIMIDETGRVLLTDFGIARVTEGAATATMVGAGTPAYMAPEQIGGADPSPQTDIYALGIVLFELLTGGERPFTGEHATITGTIGEKIRWEKRKLKPPSVRQFNENITPDVENVIARSLIKNRRHRYKTISNFLEELDNAVGTNPAPLPKKVFIDETLETVEIPKAEAGRPSEDSRKNQIPIIAIGGLGLLLLFIMGFSLFRNQPSTPADTSADNPEPQVIVITQTSKPTSSIPTRTSTPAYTNTPKPTPTMASCKDNVRVTEGRKDSKGLYLDVCWEQGVYEVGPLAEGYIGVGPNNKFFAFVTTYADVFAWRVGEKKPLHLGKLTKLYHYTVVDDVPDFEVTFYGDHPYKVVVTELNENQSEYIPIPRYITTSQD